MSATAQTARPRPSVGRPAAARAPLAVVAPPRAKHGRSLFVAMVATVLGLGLAALLTMNTVLAQDAFVLSSLQQRNAQLAVTEQALASEVAAQEDPNALASRARVLGMHPSGPPVFLNLETGTVLGSRGTGTSYGSQP